MSTRVPKHDFPAWTRPASPGRRIDTYKLAAWLGSIGVSLAIWALAGLAVVELM